MIWKDLPRKTIKCKEWGAKTLCMVSKLLLFFFNKTEKNIHIQTCLNMHKTSGRIYKKLTPVTCKSVFSSVDGLFQSPITLLLDWELPTRLRVNQQLHLPDSLETGNQSHGDLWVWKQLSQEPGLLKLLCNANHQGFLLNADSDSIGGAKALKALNRLPSDTDMLVYSSKDLMSSHWLLECQVAMVGWRWQ